MVAGLFALAAVASGGAVRPPGGGFLAELQSRYSPYLDAKTFEDEFTAQTEPAPSDKAQAEPAPSDLEPTIDQRIDGWVDRANDLTLGAEHEAPAVPAADQHIRSAAVDNTTGKVDGRNASAAARMVTKGAELKRALERRAMGVQDEIRDLLQAAPLPADLGNASSSELRAEPRASFAEQPAAPAVPGNGRVQFMDLLVLLGAFIGAVLVGQILLVALHGAGMLPPMGVLKEQWTTAGFEGNAQANCGKCVFLGCCVYIGASFPPTCPQDLAHHIIMTYSLLAAGETLRLMLQFYLLDKLPQWQADPQSRPGWFILSWLLPGLFGAVGTVYNLIGGYKTMYLADADLPQCPEYHWAFWLLLVPAFAACLGFVIMIFVGLYMYVQIMKGGVPQGEDGMPQGPAGGAEEADSGRIEELETRLHGIEDAPAEAQPAAQDG